MVGTQVILALLLRTDGARAWVHKEIERPQNITTRMEPKHLRQYQFAENSLPHELVVINKQLEDGIINEDPVARRVIIKIKKNKNLALVSIPPKKKNNERALRQEYFLQYS